MDAKQCDRCKQLYVVPVSDNVERIEENGGRRATAKVDYTNAYQTMVTLYLCQDCKRQFLEWLDKGGGV